MYDLPASLLVANPLKPLPAQLADAPQFKKDANGGLTLYIQKENPTPTGAKLATGAEGPFLMWMRSCDPAAHPRLTSHSALQAGAQNSQSPTPTARSLVVSDGINMGFQ
jgi:hypothetical protein